MANNCCIFDEIIIFRLILLSKSIFFYQKNCHSVRKFILPYYFRRKPTIWTNFKPLENGSVTFKSFCTWLVMLDSFILQVASNMSKVLLFSLASEICQTTFLTLDKKEKNKWLIFSHDWFRKFLKPFPILDGFKNFWNHFPKKGCVSND